MGNFTEGEPVNKDSFALNEELDNAITEMTMTDLKLQKRELQGGPTISLLTGKNSCYNAILKRFAVERF